MTRPRSRLLVSVAAVAVVAFGAASCGTPSTALPNTTTSTRPSTTVVPTTTPPTTTPPTTTTTEPPATTTSSTTTTVPPTTSSTTTTTTPPPTTTTATTTTTTVPPTTSTSTTVPGGSHPPLPGGLGGREWNSIPTHEKLVALTFDAGANDAGLTSILATLRRDHVKATFFPTGAFVEQYEADARAIVAAGMRIADHSVTHPYFTDLTNQQIHDQVLNARNEIRAVTGVDPWPWFRFPYFDRDERTIAAVNAIGFVPIGWTVDTLGYQGTRAGISVQSIVARVISFLQPGAIVVMHCGSNPEDGSTLDADALPKVIAALRDRGYSFVTLDALRS